MNLISLATLSASDVRAIWKLAKTEGPPLRGTAAWSFEGNGVRTRATFFEAFRRLGLACTELPNLLKSDERPCDLAGYLDPLFDLYVIRESNHTRLAEFAAASSRPVVNAMSNDGHPCEVLTDACFIDTSLNEITSARICLWGPPTNVFRSWHELAHVLGIDVVQVCEARWHFPTPNVLFQSAPPVQADIVITDGWPAGSESEAISLSEADLARMGSPALLPTPPFTIGRELNFDPLGYPGFTGYRQKALLLPVQIAIIRYLLDNAGQEMARPFSGTTL